MEMNAFAPGTVIFREGETGDTAYLVASGLVEISCQQDGKTVILGEIKAGNLFGEMALISDQPRSANAIAKEQCVVYLVPRAVFETELNGTSALMRSLVLNLIHHVHSLIAQLEAAGPGKKPGVIIHKAINFKKYKT
jgi:CRP/FNR family cyclic AMP-dependent transcriptional regulator